jgi:hypothetical protein
MKASLGVGGSYGVDLQEHPALYWRLSRREVAGARRVADCSLTIALLEAIAAGNNEVSPVRK